MELLARTLLGWLLFQAPPARDIVKLEMVTGMRDGCGESKIDFRRSLPDGSISAEAFRVPAGRQLVVTDVDWYYSSGAVGQVLILSLVVENLAEPEKRARAFESTIRLGPDGVGGASERMTTGFVVGPAARVCVETRNGPIGSPPRLSKILLRGYLSE